MPGTTPIIATPITIRFTSALIPRLTSFCTKEHILSRHIAAAAKNAGIAGNTLSLEISVASSQATITVTDNKNGISEVSSPIGATPVMTVAATVAGGSAAATMTITAKALTTSITGTGAAALNIDLSLFDTIQQLVDYINVQAGYVATVGANQNSANPIAVLDHVTAVSILTTAATVCRDAYDIGKFFAASALVDFTQTKMSGIPTAIAKTFMSNGVTGATSQANITNCIDALAKKRVNFVVTLFSRDATDDILDGLTDGTSGYQIAATNAAVKSHCNTQSSIKGKKERQGYVAFKGTFANTKLAQAALGSARVTLNFQDVDVTSADGTLYLAQPHMLSVINAAMKCSASVGLSNLNKLANINGFKQASFDPETDASDAISANLSFVQKASGGGFVFGIDNSTYGQDKDAWIWNRPSVIYAADTCAYSLRLNLEKFVGQRNSDVSVELVKTNIIQVLDSLRNAGLLVADANTGGKGYKDLAVTINGSVCSFEVTLALVENLEFILGKITVNRASS